MQPSSTTAEAHELLRIERFIAAYNRIDDYLQADLSTAQTFRSAVDFWAKKHPWWHDAEKLRLYATLRNFLVHEKTLPYDYPCVPSAAAVEDIERIGEHLIRPVRVGDQFLTEVITLSPSTTLRRALELMDRHGHGRFPIYEGRRFVGVLNENTVARALAHSVSRGLDLDLDSFVHSVLQPERKRRTYRFAAPQLPLSQVVYWFQENTFLETVLVTADGHEQGMLKGIVTRGDLVGRVG